jgi:hypothetical protein
MEKYATSALSAASLGRITFELFCCSAHLLCIPTSDSIDKELAWFYCIGPDVGSRYFQMEGRND